MTGLTRPAVLVTEWIDPSGVERLEQFATVIRPDATDEAAIARAAAACAALVVRVAPITPVVIDAAPALRLIQKHGVGVDSIDLAHATARGIPVCYTPEANAVAVAEHAVAAALAASKRLPYQDALLRDGGWREDIDPPVIELAGRTVGIIGSGRIGRRVIRALVQGLGMRGVVFDPYLDAAAVQALGAEPLASLPELLGQADIVSLHVPLTAETRHLIDAAALAQMRPEAVLVNTCRGPVVDEAALAQALRDGVIAGAAIDVFAQEPATTTPLLDAPNVILTPHNAGLTAESNRRLAQHAAEEVARVLGGHAPRWCLNPEVLKRSG